MKKYSAKAEGGAVVIFYNYRNVWHGDPANSFPGEFTYITENPVDKKHWENPGTEVKFDDKGRAIITAKFNGAGAKIVLFGVE